MRISSTQPTQNLFLNDQTGPINPSLKILPIEPQSYSTIHRSYPQNRPQLTILKADDSGDQGWKPLAKLALATAAVIKATALGYLFYIYNKSTSEIPSTQTVTDQKNKPFKTVKPITLPTTPTIANISDDQITQGILYPESMTLSSIAEVIGTAGIPLVIGGIFGYFISKRIKTADTPKDLLTQKNDLSEEIIQLEAKKTELETRVSNLNKESITATAHWTEKLKQIQKTAKNLLLEKKQMLQNLQTQQNVIKNNLSEEIESLEEKLSQLRAALNEEELLNAVDSRKKLGYENEMAKKELEKTTQEILKKKEEYDILFNQFENLLIKKNTLDALIVQKKSEIEVIDLQQNRAKDEKALTLS